MITHRPPARPPGAMPAWRANTRNAFTRDVACAGETHHLELRFEGAPREGSFQAPLELQVRGMQLRGKIRLLASVRTSRINFTLNGHRSLDFTLPLKKATDVAAFIDDETGKLKPLLPRNELSADNSRGESTVRVTLLSPSHLSLHEEEGAVLRQTTRDLGLCLAPRALRDEQGKLRLRTDCSAAEVTPVPYRLRVVMARLDLEPRGALSLGDIVKGDLTPA